jgi:hypothetical protein
METDDLITSVFHADVLDLIPILSLRKVMGRPVHIDHSLMVIV